MGTVSIIAALGEKTRALGKDGELLFSIPEDLKRFKALTLGHPVIMGRKTWESLPEKVRPLPGRTNIVLTSKKEYRAEGAEVVYTKEDALRKASASQGASEIFIIGGGEVYAVFLPFTNRLYLTLVPNDAEGDVFFPPYENFTKIISEEHLPSHSFVILEK